MNVIFTAQEIANPVLMVQDYVHLHDNLGGAKTALFLHENGSHPLCSWFELKFFTVLDQCFGGHSPCAGYAAFLASLVVSGEIIQAMGHWCSEDWKIYIWEYPAVRVEQHKGV
jgi:hypothetical protein